jgi:hypothetical protein
MRSALFSSGLATGIKLTSLLILVLGATLCAAEEVGSLTSVDDEAEVDTGRVHHPYVLAFSGSVVHLLPINILKEEIYDINDLTKASFGYAAEVRAYILDGLAISVGGMRTGFPMVDHRNEQMAEINTRFEGDPINSNNFIRMDGLFLNLTAYIGSAESKFNPYMRAGIMYFDWALESDGRGSDTIKYQDVAIEGTDFGGGFGLGTEYKLANKAQLDFQLFWGYVATGDEIKYDGLQSPVNDSFYWTNTQFWNLSLGLVFGL